MDSTQWPWPPDIIRLGILESLFHKYFIQKTFNVDVVVRLLITITVLTTICLIELFLISNYVKLIKRYFYVTYEKAIK